MNGDSRLTDNNYLRYIYNNRNVDFASILVNKITVACIKKMLTVPAKPDKLSWFGLICLGPRDKGPSIPDVCGCEYVCKELHKVYITALNGDFRLYNGPISYLYKG